MLFISGQKSSISTVIHFRLIDSISLNMLDLVITTECKPNIGLSFEIQHHAFVTRTRTYFYTRGSRRKTTVPRSRKQDANIHVYHLIFFLIKMENLQENSLFGLSALQLIESTSLSIC